MVTVSFPVVAPQATIYQDAVTNGTTGFQWEGEMDATGQVKEQVVIAGQVAEPTAESTPEVAYGGASFYYDDALAGDVTVETAPAVAPAGPSSAFGARSHAPRSTSAAHICR